ncbi:MAG: hypothetical protein WCP61_05175 [Chitinophagia bacterium]|jgi:hypothetical protein
MKKIYLLGTLLSVLGLILPCDAQKNIIGNTQKIGKLEVAQRDLPSQLKWDEAFKACAKLGPGWRLPNKEELNLLYLNKAKIGGLSGQYYWTVSESSDGRAWLQFFNDGTQDDYYKISKCWVRAVHDL